MKKNILKISSLENTKAHMPHYNPYQTGHGVHGDRKYNRNKEKNKLRQQIQNDF